MKAVRLSPMRPQTMRREALPQKSANSRKDVVVLSSASGALPTQAVYGTPLAFMLFTTQEKA